MSVGDILGVAVVTAVALPIIVVMWGIAIKFFTEWDD